MKKCCPSVADCTNPTRIPHTQVAKQQGSKSCLPPGGQQITASYHMLAVPWPDLTGRLQPAPQPAQLPDYIFCIPRNGQQLNCLVPATPSFFLPPLNTMDPTHTNLHTVGAGEKGAWDLLNIHHCCKERNWKGAAASAERKCLQCSLCLWPAVADYTRQNFIPPTWFGCPFLQVRLSSRMAQKKFRVTKKKEATCF